MNYKILVIAIGILYYYENIVAQCHIDDWTALKALYESTNGDNWEEKEGWEQIKGESPPPDCDLSIMKGIILDKDYNTRVEELLLPGNNLTGFIHNEISKLKKLKTLILFNNKISGSIPNSIGELNNLVTLDIAINLLDGSIPPEIGNLSNLVWIYLFSNQLSGEIPPELGNIESLWFIYLNDNKLTGEIPEELGNLSIGIHLFLSNNQLTGTIPPVFADFFFESLTFTLFNNNMSGCFDASLTKLCDKFKDGIYGFGDSISEGNDFDATWMEFCFEGKGVCDTVNRCHPADWQALQTIYQNYGGDNWLETAGWDSVIINQDTIPETCNLDDLHGVATNTNGRVDSVNLSANQLTGNFTADWLNLDSLTYLNIANNNLSGCFDSLAVELCQELNSSYFVADSLIDKGNNFESSWSFFCTYQTCDTTSTSIFSLVNHHPLNLFPNPADEFIYINGEFPLSGNLEYALFSIHGKCLAKAILKEDKVNISSLKSGTYFLIIRNSKKVYSSRFVKI